MADSTRSCGLSPLNIYICLMMAASGAREHTLKAFAHTLGFEDVALEDFTTGMIGLYKYCTTGQNSSSIEVQTGESVWYNRQFRVNPAWEKLIVDVFGGRVGAVNANIINAWVSNKTRGKIRHVVEEEVEQMAITLVTCLYFKANWETPFERGRTTHGVFSSLSGKTELCDMMHRTGDMLYYEDDDAQLCVLPYVCENPQHPGSTPHWKALVILPKARGHDALAAAVSHFANSPAAFRKLLNPAPFGESGPSLRRQSVELSLPRFTLELQSKLAPPLSEMGLAPAFAPFANFGGMSDVVGGGSGACLGPVSHHLFIEVNEEGTEMAAVTVTGVFGGPPRVPVRMDVDRPFLFVIFDQHTATVLCSVVVGDLKE
jgi:serpin B